MEAKVGVGNIAGQVVRLTVERSNLIGQLAQTVGSSRRDDKASALMSQLEGKFAADAAGGAGHNSPAARNSSSGHWRVTVP